MKKNYIEMPSDNSRKTGRLYRQEMTKKKDAELKQYVMRHYRPSAGWCDYEIIDGTPVATSHIKYPKSSRRQKRLKRISNRTIRRGNAIGSGKGGYRRAFDYWWELD